MLLGPSMVREKRVRDEQKERNERWPLYTALISNSCRQIS
jgi:hypothetical protein